MYQSRVLSKLFNLLTVFSVFFTPLLFFIKSHDQFELPKLTFLSLLLIPALYLGLEKKEFSRSSWISWSLIMLLGVETAASLPRFSLSWSISLLGDYDNFSGLSTFVIYLFWFWVFSLNSNLKQVEKFFYFNSLAALFSSLYAIGQHFGFDFIPWNTETVVASREFASLGNPNFLSAYLAMSIPLFLCHFLKITPETENETSIPSFFSGFFCFIGLLFLLLSTAEAASLLNLGLSPTLQFLLRIFGLTVFSIFFVRLSSVKHWASTSIGMTILVLGLFSTGCRAGFLGAAFGVIFWTFMVSKNTKFLEKLREKWIKIPKITLGIFIFIAIFTLIWLNISFLKRLGESILHMGQSLAVSRLHIWGPAIKMALAKPLLGVGLDNFKIAFPQYSGIEYNQIDGMFNSSRMAHNELLQMACTTGSLGLLAYLGVLAAFIFIGWKAYHSAKPTGQWLLIAVFSSALAYHVQNFFSFGVASINLLWFLMLAIVHGIYCETIPPVLQPSFGRRTVNLLLKTALVLFLILTFWFPLSRLGADMAFAESNAASEFLKHSDSSMTQTDLLLYSNYQVDRAKRAVGLFPMEVKYRLYLGLAYEQRAELDTGHSLDWNLEAIRCYRDSIQMSPSNAYYYNDEGRIFDRLGLQDPQY